MVHFAIDAQPRRLRRSRRPRGAARSRAYANAVARFSPRSRVHVDEDVEIAVAAERLHFFDARTSEAIWS